jgi:hypothetical protein
LRSQYPLDTHVIQARFYESVFPTEDYGSGALLYVPERTNTSRYPIALRAAGWQTAVSPSFGLVDVVYVPSERSALELRTYSRVSLQGGNFSGFFCCVCI